MGLVAVLATALDQPMPPVSGAARASDGDSFRLGDDRIRLLGLDAPELNQQCDAADGTKWPCGRRAHDRMQTLLASGTVLCQPDGHDQDGRLLATCSIAGTDLGATMVGEGLAIASGSYWKEEAEAKRQRRGIWSGAFDTPRNWRDDHARPQGLLDWLDGAMW